MCSMWLATWSSVALGDGLAAAHAVVSRLNAAVSIPRSFLMLSAAAPARFDQSATDCEMNEGTKVTITTPPFFGRRLRIESGTLRGTAHSARADECDKITGASATSR